ncbi:VapC toxin family PIN domain ribonuclease [Cyanobium sp. BA5m-10]|uniref:PIN domain-containing protein n=1 Tax=Cyanobium sp. BA5m-10 TaxID=2823705 RepID=UPI0020CD619F|nr:PIN domain-containing protein [Cyanobium sp. BA5m-10]MCP9903260.1 VapC toxin family PIN domain ribonuclease [Cyanobium sp. BA5m-10]
MAGSLVLLDTSALLTLRDDEPGADLVEQALEHTQRCYACFLSRMEVLYRVWKDANERAGRLAYEQFKARHSLSVADALIAAAALQVGATLLHKYPEFRAIADLPQAWLG